MLFCNLTGLEWWFRFTMALAVYNNHKTTLPSLTKKQALVINIISFPQFATKLNQVKFLARTPGVFSTPLKYHYVSSKAIFSQLCVRYFISFQLTLLSHSLMCKELLLICCVKDKVTVYCNCLQWTFRQSASLHFDLKKLMNTKNLKTTFS